MLQHFINMSAIFHILPPLHVMLPSEFLLHFNHGWLSQKSTDTGPVKLWEKDNVDGLGKSFVSALMTMVFIVKGSALCSPAPMFLATYIPRYLCSPVPMFPGVTVCACIRFACVIRSGYLVLANQHTSSEGQGSRDLRQTRVEPY